MRVLEVWEIAVSKTGGYLYSRALLALGEGARLMILAPLPPERCRDTGAAIADLQAQGFVRARINGKLVELAEAPSGLPATATSIEVIVDRLRVAAAVRQRLARLGRAGLHPHALPEAVVGQGVGVLME